MIYSDWTRNLDNVYEPIAELFLERLKGRLEAMSQHMGVVIAVEGDSNLFIDRVELEISLRTGKLANSLFFQIYFICA